MKEIFKRAGISLLAVFGVLVGVNLGEAQEQRVVAFLPYLVKQSDPILTFGQGQKIVGADIAPGTYRTRTASPNCYWARLSGFGGSLGEILANDNTNGPTVVTIASTDKGFESQRCGAWSTDLSAITSSPSSPLAGDGVFIVGTDLDPGLWSAENVTNCYWARLGGFSGRLADIIANHNASGTALVQIAPSDRGFQTDRCVTWTKVP